MILKQKMRLCDEDRLHSRGSIAPIQGRGSYLGKNLVAWLLKRKGLRCCKTQGVSANQFEV